MVLRKQNQNAGFSLIEVLVAITILGFVFVPICSSLVLSFRLNARSEQNLQAQLAVSSAVETIMAEGYNTSSDYYETDSRFSGLTVSGSADGAAYEFTVTDDDTGISVTTHARKGGGT